MTRQDALMTLGLNISAREAEIRAAWRKKAKFFHPDSPYGDVRTALNRTPLRPKRRMLE